MAAAPDRPNPSLSPAEMQLLVARAGLTLNPGQMADLVLTWRQLSRLSASIPRDRPMVDDQAYVFRLPPPAPSQEPRPKPAAKPARKPVRSRR